MNKPIKNQNGFLLLAMLFALLIIGVVFTVVYFNNFNKFNSSKKTSPVESLKTVEQKFSQKSTSSQSKQPCDLNLDATCDEADMEIFNKQNGQCNSQLMEADANKDGCVDSNDRKTLFQK